MKIHNCWTEFPNSTCWSRFRDLQPQCLCCWDLEDWDDSASGLLSPLNRTQLLHMDNATLRFYVLWFLKFTHFCTNISCWGMNVPVRRRFLLVSQEKTLTQIFFCDVDRNNQPSCRVENLLYDLLFNNSSEENMIWGSVSQSRKKQMLSSRLNIFSRVEAESYG